MIFKQETIQSWFSGVGSSINSEVIQPFQNAEQVIWKYNQAIQHNSLTQQGWERLLAQSDDSLKAYLTSIKGTAATMNGYNVSLQGNIIGFKKVSSAITQYNALSASGAKEQNIFANAVSVTNSKLGTYLTGLNGAKASIGGYVVSLVGATVKTVALKVATIALNSAITMGASLIISGIVSAISEWIHKTENMISASEDAIGKIKSINDELKNNQKTISDTAKRYAELAQGVNQLTGENISLSNEDYEEFLTLSNQLAEMFPTLTRNYNDNGDAIVQLSGDVDTIVGSLQNLIEAQRDLANRQIVDELPTVFDGVAAKSNEYEQQLSDLESRRDALVKSLGDVQSEEFSSNFMDGFSNKWIEISGDNLEVISQMRDDYMKILKEANIDFEELTPTYEVKDGIEVPVGFTIKINSSDEDVAKAKNTIDSKIQELASRYETDINKLNEEINITNEKNKANWTSLSSSIFAWLSTDDSFKVMDDTMQATVQNIVNSLDWEKLNFSSWEDAKQYIQDNILSLFNTPEGKETLADIEVMFGIQTQFNNGDITVEQYQQKLQDFLNSIENLPPKTKKSILLLFGIQTNDDGTTTSDVDTMVENVKKKLKGTEFDDKVGELSLEDLKIAADLKVGDDTIQSWDDLIERIEKVKSEGNKTDTSYNFDDFWKSIGDTEKATALKEELFKLASSGELTGSKLKSLAKDNELLKSAMDSTELSANKLAEGIRELNINNIESDINLFADALDKVKNKQSLTTEETAKLIAKDNSLAGAVKRTKDGYLLEKDALSKLVDSHKEKYNVAVSYEINETNNTINRIKDRIEAYNKEIKALSEVSKARDKIGGTKSGSYSDTLAQLELEKKNKKEQKKLKTNQKKLKEFEDSLKNVSSNSGTSSKSSKSPKSKDSTKNTKTEINWLERRLTRMQSIIDLTASKLQNLFTVKAKNNNLNKQIKQTTKLMNQYKIAADEYMKKANSVAKASKNEDGKKVPALSKDIINKVQSGKITKASYSKLIKKYGQDYADKINSYIDYYDKAQEAKKNVQEQKAKIRQDKIDQQQNKVDYAEAKIDLLEQRKEYATNAKDKIKYLNQEKKYYTDSYNAQIKIAKLDGNKIEAQRLQVELEQKLRDLQKEQLEITEEQQQSELDLIQAQKERAKDYGSKNSVIDSEIAKTNELYNIQIAIANLEGKSEEAQKLQIEREQQLIALQKEKFDNITHQYENQRKLLENSYKNLSNTSDELEARGLIVGASLYSSQIDLNNLKKSGYEEELKLLESQLPQIEQGTDEWYDALDAIQACKDGISDATKNTIELNTAIRNIPFLVNEKITSRLELVSSEFELLNKYMSNKKLVDNDTGNFTNEGTATLATYYAQLLLMQKETQNTKTALDDMLSAIKRGDKGYEDKEKAMQEYYEKYQEYIDLSGKEWDIQQKLIDLMKDKYQSELDYLQDIINKRKELLQAEKDAYDYSRTLQEKSKTISGLQKQLEASKGDDSEAGKLRIQQLQVSLDEAKQDLQDTEYDKWISDQQEMLDKLYNEYSAFIDDHMNDVDALLEEAIEYLKDPRTKNDFLDTWDEYMTKYGFDAETGGLGGILTALGKEGSIVSAINNLTNTIVGYYMRQQEKADKIAYDNEMRANNSPNTMSGIANSVQTPITPTTPVIDPNQVARDKVKNWIVGNAGNANYWEKRKYTEASDVQKKIHDKIYDPGKGKRYMSGTGLHELQSFLHVTDLLQYLNSIGYSDGGIVGTLQKVPGMNGDDGWVTLKKGEAVLTPEQAKQFQALAKNLDILNPAVNILSDLQKPNLDFVPNRNITQSVGDIHINMEFPNVTNYEDFRSKMQSDPKIEKMFKSMIWDKGDLSKYNIRM